MRSVVRFSSRCAVARLTCSRSTEVCAVLTAWRACASCASLAASAACACCTLVSAESTAARAFCTSESAACALAACASALDSSCVGSTRTSGCPVVTWSPGLTFISTMRPCTSLVRLTKRMGRTSPEAVTVDFSSGRTSTLTTVTSGSSLPRAKMLMTTMIAMTATAATAMMIFFFRLTAMWG